MSSTKNVQRPLRIGIFDTVTAADAAVTDLFAAGFDKAHITVICSEAAIQDHFKQFEHQDPAGTNTPGAALAGGACGASLAAIAAVALASFATMGGAALIATGGIALWGGSVVGGLVGAMMSRGVEKELANFYDQAVTRGKILVAAEQDDPAQQQMLVRASEIFNKHGVESMPLAEG